MNSDNEGRDLILEEVEYLWRDLPTIEQIRLFASTRLLALMRKRRKNIFTILIMATLISFGMAVYFHLYAGVFGVAAIFYIGGGSLGMGTILLWLFDWKLQ